jgi:chemotaxis protein histidine kinase CheA
VAAFNQHAVTAAPAASGDASEPLAAAPAANGLDTLLKSLTTDVSRASGRNVQLRLDGLDAIPASHERRVRDICVQMVRNSIVHGVESPEQRAGSGKPPGGVVRVSFSDSGKDEYALLIEDDGQGLSYERILNRALQMDLVKPAQVMNMDRAAIFRLIFMPGFSTAESVSDHAGRGVGLDAVNALVRDAGGRIGISTAPGQFTRFKIVLPKTMAMAQSTTG